MYLEVEVQNGRHVGALRETLQGRQKEGESHSEVFTRREGKNGGEQEDAEPALTFFSFR